MDLIVIALLIVTLVAVILDRLDLLKGLLIALLLIIVWAWLAGGTGNVFVHR